MREALVASYRYAQRAAYSRVVGRNEICSGGPPLNRPQEPDAHSTPSRRKVLKTGAAFAGAASLSPLYAFASQSSGPPTTRPAQNTPQIKIFDVLKYGAAGDGKTLDSAAFQRAIDEAAAYSGKAQVLVRGGHKYLIGTIELKGSIDFHLADDAATPHQHAARRLSRRPARLGQNGDTMSAALGAVIMATGAQGLTITGTGNIQGRAKEFMTRYDEAGGMWMPGPFRPKMFVLTGCKDLVVRDITFAEAPNWGLHMLGCDGVLVDNVKIRNLLDVPNCDGIDPDHCRNVEIRNCNITCGDDGVVIKCSRQPSDYGPAANIHVHDCVIETQDSGLKIGTETTSDIHDILFERCQIKTSSRGLCIQLRDEGNIHDIDFRDITFTSRFYADPWWGRGEAISFTAIPRTADQQSRVVAQHYRANITGHAENSVRVCGSASHRVHDITLDRVAVTLARTTKFPGQSLRQPPDHRDPGHRTPRHPRLLHRTSRQRHPAQLLGRLGRQPARSLLLRRRGRRHHRPQNRRTQRRPSARLPRKGSLHLMRTDLIWE